MGPGLSTWDSSLCYLWSCCYCWFVGPRLFTGDSSFHFHGVALLLPRWPGSLQFSQSRGLPLQALLIPLSGSKRLTFSHWITWAVLFVSTRASLLGHWTIIPLCFVVLTVGQSTAEERASPVTFAATTLRLETNCR